MRGDAASRFCLCACLLALSAVCSAQARGASPPSDPKPPPDSRLGTPVTARLKAVPLRTALKDLSKQTGVRMAPSEEVAELKVTLLVRGLPLKTLQESLSEVLHLAWLREEGERGAPPAYRLVRSLRNRAEEEELVERGEKAFRRGIDEAIQALSLSPDELDKLLETRKSLAETFRYPGGRAAVEFVSMLSSQQRQAVMDGQRIELTADQLSPGLRDKASQILQQVKAGQSDMPHVSAISPNARFSVARTGEGGKSVLGIGFREETDLMCAEAGVPIKGTHDGEVYPEFYAAGHIGSEYDECRAEVTAGKEMRGKDFEDLLDQVADTFHLNIVAESYRQHWDKEGYPPFVRAGRTTVENVLDRIVWGNRWWKRGPVYLIQRPKWWVDRRSQISDAALDRARAILKRKPVTLDDWAEIATFVSGEQWNGLNSLELADVYCPGEAHALLAFYGSLPRLQRPDAFAPEGLAGSRLGPADKERLAAWISPQKTTPYGRPLRPASLAGLPMNLVRVVATAREGAPATFRVLLLSPDSPPQTLCEQTAPGLPRKR